MTGSGPEGRIIKRDIDGIAASSSAATSQQAAKVSSGLSSGGYRDVELSLIRKTIAKRMQESKQQVPHFYAYDRNRYGIRNFIARSIH